MFVYFIYFEGTSVIRMFSNAIQFFSALYAQVTVVTLLLKQYDLMY